MSSYRHISAVIVIPTSSEYDRRLWRHAGGVEWSAWNDLMQSDVCGNCGHISVAVSSSSSSSSMLFITLRRIKTDGNQISKDIGLYPNNRKFSWSRGMIYIYKYICIKTQIVPNSRFRNLPDTTDNWVIKKSLHPSYLFSIKFKPQACAYIHVSLSNQLQCKFTSY